VIVFFNDCCCEQAPSLLAIICYLVSHNVMILILFKRAYDDIVRSTASVDVGADFFHRCRTLLTYFAYCNVAFSVTNPFVCLCVALVRSDKTVTAKTVFVTFSLKTYSLHFQTRYELYCYVLTMAQYFGGEITPKSVHCHIQSID